MAPFYKKETISKMAYKKLIAILEEHLTIESLLDLVVELPICSATKFKMVVTLRPVRFPHKK